MSNERYPSNLTDREWEYLKPGIPPAKRGGRERQTCLRQTLNAIFYIARTGCQWRYLPADFPPWQTVYGYLRRWQLSGVWERMTASGAACGRRKGGTRNRLLPSSRVKVSRPPTGAEPHVALMPASTFSGANAIF